MRCQVVPHHWSKLMAHGIEGSRADATTCTDTTDYDSIDVATVELRSQIGPEECGRVALGDDDFTSGGL